jgi:hypothetical protein
VHFESTAKVVLDGETLPDRVRSFVARLRALGRPSATTEVRLHLAAHPERIAPLARRFPAVVGFRLGKTWEPRRTGAAFLRDLGGRHRHAQATLALAPPASFADALAVLEDVAATLPPDGKGATLWIAAGPLQPAEPAGVVAGLELDAHVATTRKATLRVRAEGAGEDDPALRRLVAAAGDRLGAKLGRPSPAHHAWLVGPPGGALKLPATGPAAPPPPRPGAAQWVPVHVAFEAALDEAARELDVAPPALELPRLYLHGEAGDVRAQALLAGRVGPRVNLTPRMKAVVRERIPGWTFVRAEGDEIVFERRLGPTLAATLVVDKLSLSGLGKCFTLAVGFDLPNTPFAGLFVRRSLFELVRRSWSRPAFAWATAEELEEALASCGEVLVRLVPVYERHLAARLGVLPEALPSDLARRGPLSAREALAIARPELDRLAPGAGLTGIWHTGPRFGQAAEPPEVPGGRLAPFACWVFAGESRAMGTGALVTVPATGAIRAEARRLDLRVGGWREEAFADGAFADSGEIAALAEAEAQEQAPGASFTLRALGVERLAPRDGRFGWRAFGTWRAPSAERERRLDLFLGLRGER